MSQPGVVFQQPGATYPPPNQLPPAYGVVTTTQPGVLSGKAPSPYAGTPMETLEGLHQLFVQQKRTVMELFTGCEAKNKYLIKDATSTVSDGNCPFSFSDVVRCDSS